MRDAPRSRSRAVTTFVVLVVGLGASFGACSIYERDNGSACIKDTDCNSGYCVQQVCSSPPPALQGTSYGDDAAQDTGSEDSGGDSSPTPSDGGSDGDAPAAPPQDSGNDTGADASDGAIVDGGQADARDASDD